MKTIIPTLEQPGVKLIFQIDFARSIPRIRVTRSKFDRPVRRLLCFIRNFFINRETRKNLKQSEGMSVLPRQLHPRPCRIGSASGSLASVSTKRHNPSQWLRMSRLTNSVESGKTSCHEKPVQERLSRFGRAASSARLKSPGFWKFTEEEQRPGRSFNIGLSRDGFENRKDKTRPAGVRGLFTTGKIPSEWLELGRPFAPRRRQILSVFYEFDCRGPRATTPLSISSGSRVIDTLSTVSRLRCRGWPTYRVDSRRTINSSRE